MLTKTREGIGSDSKLALLVIAGFTIVRAAIAFTLELGTDEAYYWFYSQELKWNYFDHPPMVAVWVRLFTANLLLQDYEGFIRLGSLAGGFLSSWFIFKTCSLLHSQKAGLFGVFLYNTSFFAAITAGVFIMPDAPMMVFYTLCMLLLARITTDDTSWGNWILFGIVTGCCILSKIYGIFILFGLGGYVLIKQRRWLRTPQLYVSLLMTLTISSIILVGDINEGLEGITFHMNRLTIKEYTISLYTFGREIVNQLLFNNPFNVVLAIVALFRFNRTKEQLPALSIFNFIGLSLAFLLLVVSLFRDTTLPHWSGPAYVALIPLSAVYLASAKARIRLPGVIKGSVAAFVVFVLVWQSLIHFYPKTLGDKENDRLTFQKATPTYLLEGFSKLQLVAEPIDKGWSEAGEQFASFYEGEIKKGIVREGTPVVSHNWWGAQILYYFCYPTDIGMITLGRKEDLHEFMHINELNNHAINLSNAYCIVPANYDYNLYQHYMPYYNKIDRASVIQVDRDQNPPLTFHVYRLGGWKNNLAYKDKKGQHVYSLPFLH